MQFLSFIFTLVSNNALTGTHLYHNYVTGQKVEPNKGNKTLFSYQVMKSLFNEFPFINIYKPYIKAIFLPLADATPPTGQIYLTNYAMLMS